MHFAGIDLAWGERQPTGLAVLDADARLLHVATVRTDDEIAEGAGAVRRRAVPGGHRRAPRRDERDRLPPSRARPEPGLPAVRGRVPTRPTPASPSSPTAPAASGSAGLLGLDLDPASRAERRAIEVYPHPATVVAVRADEDAEVQGQAWSRPRAAALGAARADGARRSGWSSRTRPGAVLREPGRVGHPQERAARGGGPGRRGGLRLRRALRRALARADHDLRRPRAGLHRDARRSATGTALVAAAVAEYARRQPELRRGWPRRTSTGSPGSSTTPASTTSASPGGPRASQSFAAKASRTDGRRARLRRARSRTSPTRSGCG